MGGSSCRHRRAGRRTQKGRAEDTEGHGSHQNKLCQKSKTGNNGITNLREGPGTVDKGERTLWGMQINTLGMGYQEGRYTGGRGEVPQGTSRVSEGGDTQGVLRRYPGDTQGEKYLGGTSGVPEGGDIQGVPRRYPGENCLGGTSRVP